MPPLTSADVDGEAAVGFVAVVGREFNRDPGGWALQTMADSEILLAGGYGNVSAFPLAVCVADMEGVEPSGSGLCSASRN